MQKVADPLDGALFNLREPGAEPLRDVDPQLFGPGREN